MSFLLHFTEESFAMNIEILLNGRNEEHQIESEQEVRDELWR